jgi:hypothetical protein
MCGCVEEGSDRVDMAGVGGAWLGWAGASGGRDMLVGLLDSRVSGLLDVSLRSRRSALLDTDM